MQIVNVYNNKNFQIYIGRPAQGADWGFGNPFVINRDGTRDEVIQKFEKWLRKGENFKCSDATVERRKWILDNIHILKEKVLGCFCFPLPCHAEVLLKLLKEEEKKDKNK